MAWQLTFYDEALLDISEAKRWYFKQQKGLEKRFAADVKESLNRIKKNPEHYQVRYKDVRLAHCTVFPYSVHFYVNQTLMQVVVIAIVHQHRDPDFVNDRD